MRLTVTVITLGLLGVSIWFYNLGLVSGMTTIQPQFDSRVMTEVGCSEIEPYEHGVKCVVFMDSEDSNVRVYKGLGALDD